MKRVVKHPRGFLRDTGLLHARLRIPDLNALLSHPQAGASRGVRDFVTGQNARVGIVITNDLVPRATTTTSLACQWRGCSD